MAAPVITWDDVLNLPAPELASVPVPAQNAILAAVGNQVPANQWGALQALGQAYLAAHMASLGRRGKGLVTSQSVGGVSQDFSDLTSAFGALGLTSYGVEYGRLVRQLAAVAMGFVP